MTTTSPDGDATPADPGAIDTYPMSKHGWTCFHCGETFTTFGAARDHFGATPEAEIGCLINKVRPGEERGLLMALRKSEAIVEALRARVLVETIQSTKALEQALKQKNRAEAAEAREAALAGALEPLIDDDECRLDHSGFCQTHTNELDDGRCAMVAARAVLAATPADAMERANLGKALIKASDAVIDTGRRVRSDPGSHELALANLCAVMGRIATLDALGKEKRND